MKAQQKIWLSTNARLVRRQPAFGNIAAGLKEHGFSEADAAGIMGKTGCDFMIITDQQVDRLVEDQPIQTESSNMVTLRPAAEVMRLDRMGSLHQSRLSFMRLLRRLKQVAGYLTALRINKKGIGINLPCKWTGTQLHIGGLRP